jgi:hypothetical protein
MFEVSGIDRQRMCEYDHLCAGVHGRRRRVKPLEKLRRLDSPRSFVTRLNSSYICMICTRQYVTYPALVRHLL